MGRDPRTERDSYSIDPVTGEDLADHVVNPWVAGDLEEPPDPATVREWFDQQRRENGLAAAKEALPEWENYTLPGDPYPIPRPTEEAGGDTRAIKGEAGFLVDTNADNWSRRFVDKVRERAGQNSDS